MTEDQIDSTLQLKLIALQTAFLEINTQINLSALRTEDSCWKGNILDSLAGLETIEALTKTSDSIIDIGTGGGFPLLPLAMVLPNRNFVGLDSTQKKLTAIQGIIDQIGLNNVQLICSRCETIGRESQHREQYQLVTSRAVAPLNVLLEYMAPLAAVNGHLLCWKSMQIEQELLDSLVARNKLECHLIDRITYTLPGDFGTRQLLIFKKTAILHKKYPREIGTPKKTPLL